jgi:RNA polymerase sigma factor (sigma-70 family)
MLQRLRASPADEDAWSSLYRQLWPFVFAVVHRRLQTSAVEDAAQEVFIKLLRSRPYENISDADAFRAYVWRMADNVAKTHLLKQHADQHAKRDLAEWQQFEPSGEALDGEGALVANELLGLAENTLDAKDRDLLRMMLEGANLAQAADKLGLSYSNAGVRLHRMRRRLSGLLGSREKEMLPRV